MKKTPSSRLDLRLVELGLAETRAKAQALIMAGSVLVEGEVRDKPGTRVKESAAVALKERTKYVSRGGLKLEGALDALGIDPAGKICLDVGASTGGFSDCLLQRGAARVYAVDVGKGLLALKLAQDARVKVMDEVNARYLAPEQVPEPIALAVMDLSFISLSLVLPAVVRLLQQDAILLPLVKPQFEAGRAQVGKGGVVRDPDVQKACVDKIAKVAAGLGFHEIARLASPLKGPKGNQEFFLHLAPKAKE